MIYHGKKVKPDVFAAAPAQHYPILKMYVNTSPQSTQRSLRIQKKQIILFHYEQTVMVLTSKTSVVICTFTMYELKNYVKIKH